MPNGDNTVVALPNRNAFLTKRTNVPLSAIPTTIFPIARSYAEPIVSFGSGLVAAMH